MKKRTQNVQRPVLAISSGGGHWVQLLRLKPAWAAYPVVYASVESDYRHTVEPAQYFTIPDGNRHTKTALFKVMWKTFRLVLEHRPAVVISTGAAPGFFAVMWGKILGARTVWVDSIANAEHLSLCGKAVRPFTDLWLTQWEELSSPKGPRFYGSIV